MKTVEIKIYSFAELSEEAKQTAINNYREINDVSYIYDEAHATVKAFHAIFNTKEGRQSWLDVYTDHIDNTILNLKGFRLRKYILNNFGQYLYKRKYLKSFDGHKKHRMIENRTAQTTNKKYCFAYSNIQINNCCALTGVCYDEDILKPIYDFIDMKVFSSYTTFNKLLNECFENLRDSLEKEEEYRNSYEVISEEIEANAYEFTEDGERF